MVMGRRPDVPTAGAVETVRALLGMLAAIVRRVVHGLRRRPWRNSPEPGRAVESEVRNRLVQTVSWRVGELVSHPNDE